MMTLADLMAFLMDVISLPYEALATHLTLFGGMAGGAGWSVLASPDESTLERVLHRRAACSAMSLRAIIPARIRKPRGVLSC